MKLVDAEHRPEHDTTGRLRARLTALLAQWRAQGVPAATAAHTAIGELAAWRRREQVPGLWPSPPRLITATLDDALGQGIAQVGALASVVGMDVRALGPRCAPESILGAVREHHADVVGLTVLWVETAEALIEVGAGLPEGVTLVGGGPAFTADPELATDAGVHLVAADLADFLEWLLARS